jgi:hypothetical protein
VKVTAPILIALILSAVATASPANSTDKSETLTGRFVASVDGPPLTGFGANREFYIFEAYSGPAPHLVILSYTFFLYEPVMQRRALDYSRLYTLAVAPDEGCEHTIEEISKRLVFNPHGAFMEIQYALTYAKHTPVRTLPLNKTLPCYALPAQSVSSLQ